MTCRVPTQRIAQSIMRGSLVSRRPRYGSRVAGGEIQHANAGEYLEFGPQLANGLVLQQHRLRARHAATARQAVLKRHLDGAGLNIQPRLRKACTAWWCDCRPLQRHAPRL